MSAHPFCDSLSTPVNDNRRQQIQFFNSYPFWSCLYSSHSHYTKGQPRENTTVLLNTKALGRNFQSCKYLSKGNSLLTKTWDWTLIVRKVIRWNNTGLCNYGMIFLQDSSGFFKNVRMLLLWFMFTELLECLQWCNWELTDWPKSVRQT